MKNNCLTQEVMNRFILDQLDDTDKSNVIKHLGECELCSDAVEGLRLLVSEKGINSANTAICDLELKIGEKIKTSKNLNDKDHQGLFHNSLFWMVFILAFLCGIFFTLLSINKKKVVLPKPIKKNEIINPVRPSPELKKNETPEVRNTKIQPLVKKPYKAPLEIPVKDSILPVIKQQTTDLKMKVEKPVEKTDKVIASSHNSEAPKEIFTVVEEQPTYPGGDEERLKFLQRNMKYPEEAKELGIQGKVYLTFVVETDGSMTDIIVLRGIGGGCDEEAIRVVKSMPKWIPGKQRGLPVRVQFNLPIQFKIQ